MPVKRPETPLKRPGSRVVLDSNALLGLRHLAIGSGGTFGTFGNVPERGWNVPFPLICCYR
jgi:hypothetical protein